MTCKTICIIGKNPIQTTTLTLINQAHNSRMHEKCDYNERECNAWSYDNNFTRPNPNILAKPQKPKRSQQNQKARSKMHELHEEWRKEGI